MCWRGSYPSPNLPIWVAVTNKTRIESLSHDGRGITHIDGKTTFIFGALPTEEIEFEYTARRKKFDEAKMTFIDGIRADFKDGWGLVRPSNTTPCLVLRFEAENIEALKRIQAQFKKEMLLVDNTLNISF